MGYNNKRKRTKRRRTRYLNAIKNSSNIQGYPASSDDSSVLESCEQSSNYRSCCSTNSHQTSTRSDSHLIPNSIFLDDINKSAIYQETNNIVEAAVQDMEDELFSVDHQDSDHEILSFSGIYPEELSFNHLDDNSVQSTRTTSSIDDTNGSPNHGFAHSRYQHHEFDRVTRDETASFKIMSLLDSSGAPRICYDRLVALLKKLSKEDGFDVKKALNRETLMRRLSQKYRTPPKLEVCVINKQEVFRFSFVDMLQDLVYSSSNHLHEILPFCNQENIPTGTEHELWNTPWMRDTFEMPRYHDFDPKRDMMLPVIIYMDKTGTDVNQRYSLEPLLLTLAAIPRSHRESRHSWRHLGFIPQKQINSDEECTSLLQFHHDCLSYLLDGLKKAQKDPPTIMVQFPDGRIEHRRALLPLMIVMGDQLSQDTLCGRMKSNAGGAGRVHRSCMCSYLNIDDPYHQCQRVNVETLRFLSTKSLVTDDDIDSQVLTHCSHLPHTKEARAMKMFLQRQRTMFRSILRNPFTTHAIKNAFEDVDFGSWQSGIHDATFDDFMHSVEGGMVSYITESVYDGLTKKEKDSVEEMTRSMLAEQRCSVISHYPRWRLQPGFTRQTLMTSGERVGSLLALALSLNDPSVRETIRSAHGRQIQKYLDVSTETYAERKKRENDENAGDDITEPLAPPPEAEFYLNQHLHMLDDQCLRQTMEHMIRHGFVVAWMDGMDPFQVNQMIWHCAEIFKHVSYPHHYPVCNINGSYTNMGQRMKLPKHSLIQAKYALQTNGSKLLKNHRHHKVDGAIKKHLKKKAHRKGDGSTAAVLTSNMGTLIIFLEYVLSYHAFCKYSWSLPVFLQQHYENIQAGNRFVVEYFQKLIYRGNASVDSRFPKIHAQCRMGNNTAELNTVMNFCCETGERLLKTEAKGISKTAQQRGNDTFLTQTMSRIMDRLILDCFSLHLDKIENPPQHQDLSKGDQSGRLHPRFVYNVDTEEVLAINRKNEARPPDQKSGRLLLEVTNTLKKHDSHTNRFEVFNEVILRNNSRLRASPNYANSGPWYDYANVSWERVINGNIQTYLLPAKCCCFFRKAGDHNGEQELMALIHTVDQSSAGNVAGRTDTLLTRHYRMQYNTKGEPVTHVVPVASIDSAVRCFPHTPSKEMFHSRSPGLTYLLPRNHWSYMWMAVNDRLNESNSTEKLKQRKGKLISMCNSHWLESVRRTYETYLNAGCVEDLRNTI